MNRGSIATREMAGRARRTRSGARLALASALVALAGCGGEETEAPETTGAAAPQAAPSAEPDTPPRPTGERAGGRPSGAGPQEDAGNGPPPPPPAFIEGAGERAGRPLSGEELDEAIAKARARSEAIRELVERARRDRDAGALRELGERLKRQLRDAGGYPSRSP